MDDDNISDLNSKAPKGSSAKILLLGDFDPEGERIIRDPYYVIDTSIPFILLLLLLIETKILLGRWFCRFRKMLCSERPMLFGISIQSFSQ